MFETFGTDIFLANGPIVNAALGFHYPTRMAALRLAGGELLIWSPIALTPELRAATEALGPVRYLCAPNALHHVFLSDWHHAFPEATLLAAPGLAAKRPDLPLGPAIETLPETLAPSLDLVLFPNRIAPELVFFHRASQTALFCDLLQQLPPDWYRGWRRLIARMDGMCEAEPSVPKKFRLATRDRPAARTALNRIRAWPLSGVVMAHGTPISANPSVFLGRAFQWLDT